jgi:hypothetical protein
MRHSGTWLLALALLTLGMTSARPHPPAETTMRSRVTGVPRFTALTYAASGAFGQLRAELEFQPAAGAELTAGAGLEEAWVADVRMDSKPRLFWDKQTLMRTWFRPGDGEVLHATRLSVGRKSDRKVYRFRQDGAQRVRIEPSHPGEEDLPPGRWTHVKESFHAYSPDALGCSVVSDAAALFFLAASQDFSRGPGEAQHCLFSGKTLYELDIEPLGSGPFDVDYLEVFAKGNPTQRTGVVEALRWRMKARAVAGKLDEGDADLEVYLDAVTGVPLRIGSRMAGLGFLEVDLVRLVRP